MHAVKVSEAKATLSAVLRRVKRGETVLITERGRPIARITPSEPGDETEDARVRRLIDAGLLTPPRKPMAKRALRRLLATPGPPDPEGAVRQALLEERYEEP